MSYTHLTKLATHMKRAYLDADFRNPEVIDFMNRPEQLKLMNRDLEDFAKSKGLSLADLQGEAFNEGMARAKANAMRRRNQEMGGSAEAQIKKLKAQLKNEQTRRRRAAIGVGVGIPSAIAASILFDKYRKR